MAVFAEERRIVTVLFADMAGSTALGEKLDPEEMRRLLTRYYSIAREAVEQHGGTVEKFIGDAVMAVFGLPTAHGDDPDRAVAAALTMRDRIREDARLAGRLVIRFGVRHRRGRRQSRPVRGRLPHHRRRHQRRGAPAAGG